MDATQVKKQIEAEIDGNWDITNLHGVDLRRCLVEPRKVTCCWNANETAEMWLVLEEWPNEKDGYKIVYDEVEDSYCLAVLNGEEYNVLGYYGSFLNTLKGM